MTNENNSIPENPLGTEPKKQANSFLKIALVIGLFGGIICTLSCGFLVLLYYFDSGSALHYTAPTQVSYSSPTSMPFVMPKDDFEMSWDTYNSEYNSMGGILTIRKQGDKYTMRLVMSDGSKGINDLTVMPTGNEIRLTERPGNSFGDYMYISDNGYLYFCDKQGVIYSVPPLEDKQSPISESEQPIVPVQGKEINVVMSVLSVESIGGNKVKTTISTNLPNGMKLMVDLKDSGSYWAQDDPAVSDGKLVTTFGNVGTGNYRLTITSPVVSIQPENVKTILGKNGGNMVGDLITFDPSWDSYILEYKSNIEIK